MQSKADAVQCKCKALQMQRLANEKTERIKVRDNRLIGVAAASSRGSRVSDFLFRRVRGRTREGGERGLARICVGGCAQGGWGEAKVIS